MPIEKYSLSLRIVHWLTALIIFSLLIIGFYMSGLDFTDSKKETLYILHKSFGVIVFALVLVRIIIRIKSKIPPLPNTIPGLIRILSHIVQYSLYILMILMPISGYLMSNFYGFPVIFFNITLPNIVGVNTDLGKIFGEIHEVLGYCLIFALFLHIAGALKHRFFDIKENDVLPRII